ncbi:MAG: methionine--tRNA ligase [Acidobacteria bacterium]|nr:methionine--tRNA ligase [Acidobacteriota bacterium]
MAKFFLTTAIDYVNSRPHLGTAYEKIAADVIARYQRLCGVETRFMMGNDEHSQNVFQRARELGVEPLAFCDGMETAFRDVWARLDISFDDFIRTTEARHRTSVTTLVSRLAEAGDIYDGYYEGWYCVSCEAFKPEKDLEDGNCPVHGKPPQWIKEKNHFFRLSKYRQPLLDHYAAHPEFLQPEIRRNEILRLLEAGLDDISMSRTGQAWGIPVPSDPDSVIYVWVDALINYVSGVGYGADQELFETWWPADLHVIGKDITRFHCVFWPAMLMSAGLPLPRRVFGHGWVHWQGQKMSKSLGTVVDPLDAADRLGPDPLRLYLTKEIAFGQDGDFTWDRFEERYNVDLANNFGNLVSRLASMAHRYRKGRLVAPPSAPGPLAEAAGGAVTAYREAMDAFALHGGVAAAFQLVDAANEYITAVEPWATARDPARAAELDRQLYDVSEAVRIAAVLLTPVMPSSCREVLARVGAPVVDPGLNLDRDAVWTTPPGAERQVVKGDPLWPRLDPDRAASNVEKDAQRKASPPREVVGGKVRVAADAGAGAQRREQRTMNESEQPGGGAAAPAAAPPRSEVGGSAPVGEGAATAEAAAPRAPETPRISIDEFAKVELRVGRVVTAEAVRKSKKLARLEIDDGAGVRQVVAGIAKAYEPESLVGRHVVFVANLQPAKLMGIESNGMVLAALDAAGQPVLLTPDDPERAPAGSAIR